jgi:beta-glucosidase
LSYTSFEYGKASITTSNDGEFSAELSVDVTNIGTVTGSEVVQVYVTLPNGHLTHPENQLRAFAKLRDIPAGKTVTAKVKLDKYAVSYWDDSIHVWVADKGTYTAKVGGSSDKIATEVSFEVAKAFEWSGL